jgi:arsenate reductase (thioredoxin)
VTDKPVVLFLCTHNAGRSLAAKVLLDHYAQGRVDVRSAGSEPAGKACRVRHNGHTTAPTTANR